MATLEQFENVFGKLKEYRRDKMETTSKILGVKEWPNNISVKLIVNGSETYAKVSKKPENEELLESIRGLAVGSGATFDLSPWTNPKTGNETLYINSVMPIRDVNEEHDVNKESKEDMGKKSELVKTRPIDTSEVKASSYDRCNALNASTALMVVLYEKNPEMSTEDLFEMHQGFIDRVKIGAQDILDEYHK